MAKVTDEQVKRIMQQVYRANEIKQMTNEELAKRLLDDVWAQIPLGSEQELLLSEVIERLDPKLNEIGDDDGSER